MKRQPAPFPENVIAILRDHPRPDYRPTKGAGRANVDDALYEAGFAFLCRGEVTLTAATELRDSVARKPDCLWWSEDHNDGSDAMWAGRKTVYGLVDVLPDAVLVIHEAPTRRVKGRAIRVVYAAVRVACPDLESAHAVNEWLAANARRQARRRAHGAPLCVVGVNAGGGAALHEGPTIRTPLLRANYPAEIIESFDAVIHTLRQRKSDGRRLVLIDGPPGTGKSWLARGLITALPRARHILIPPGAVATSFAPGNVTFWLGVVAESEARVILYVEDADALVDTDARSNFAAGIGAVLGLGDGLAASVLDVTLVLLTNTPEGSIDPAIVRPGRLLARLHVPDFQGDADARALGLRVLARLRGVDDAPEGTTPLLGDAPKTLADAYERARAGKGNR